MSVQNAATTLYYWAWDTAANKGKTGDAANHTIRAVADGATAGGAPAGAIVENGNGLYSVPLTGAENTGKEMVLEGSSATTGISIIGVKLSNLPATLPETAKTANLPATPAAQSDVTGAAAPLTNGSYGLSALATVLNTLATSAQLNAAVWAQTRLRPSLPEAVKLPAAGSIAYTFGINVYNSSGALADCDAAAVPVVHAFDVTDTSADAKLGAVTRVGTGCYEFTFTVNAADAAPMFYRFTFGATQNGDALGFTDYCWLAYDVSPDFGTADRNLLTAAASTIATNLDAPVSGVPAAVRDAIQIEYGFTGTFGSLDVGWQTGGPFLRLSSYINDSYAYTQNGAFVDNSADYPGYDVRLLLFTGSNWEMRTLAATGMTTVGSCPAATDYLDPSGTYTGGDFSLTLARGGDLLTPIAKAAALAATSAAKVAALITPVGADSHPAINATLDSEDPAAAALKTELDGVAPTIIAALSGAPIEVRAALTPSGEVLLNTGDDYLATDGRAIQFGVPASVLDLTGAELHLRIKANATNTVMLDVIGEYAAGDVTINGKSFPGAIVFQPTSAQTAALTQWTAEAYTYKVVALWVSPAKTVTLVTDSPCTAMW